LQHRPIDRAEHALPYDVAVIGRNKAPAASKQELRQLAGRIGHVRVRDVDALLQPPHSREETETDRRRRDVELAPGLRDRHAFDALSDGVRAGVGHQHAHIHIQRAQPFSQHADVVLDAAEDGIVVFVELQGL
jgi:hypothetical protein